MGGGGGGGEGQGKKEKQNEEIYKRSQINNNQYQLLVSPLEISIFQSRPGLACIIQDPKHNELQTKSVVWAIVKSGCAGLFTDKIKDYCIISVIKRPCSIVHTQFHVVDAETRIYVQHTA